MREMEFLPGWYPHLRRRKRLVILHAWATMLVMAGLGLWLFLASRNVDHRLVDRAAVTAQLDQSRSDLKELNAQMAEKRKLETQQRIMNKVGLHVEVTRLLAKLDQIMPREMTLTDATFDTMEQTRQIEGTNDAKLQEVTRKLVVRLSGVTPSDADWAGVLAKLSSVPFFQEVRPGPAKDKVESGHVMREFEVSFIVDLGIGG